LALYRRTVVPGEKVQWGRNSTDGTTSALMYIALAGSTVQGVPAAEAAAPTAFGLLEVYPNPSLGRTTILYEAGEAGSAQLSVFDMAGRQVAELAAGPTARGTHRLAWDCGSLPGGIYFCRLATPRSVAVRKLLLLR